MLCIVQRALFYFTMDSDEFYLGLDSIADEVCWESQPLPDLWTPCRPGDYPIMLVTWDRFGRQRCCFRPFGHVGDADLCVRLLRKVTHAEGGE